MIVCDIFGTPELRSETARQSGAPTMGMTTCPGTMSGVKNSVLITSPILSALASVRGADDGARRNERRQILMKEGEMFDKGKIEVSVARTHFAPGDTITGKVSLTIKKPVAAKEVSVSLIGEQTTTRGGGLAGGERRREKERVYDFKLALDGEKEYSQGGEYAFEIKIPADILNAAGPQLEGAVGQAVKIAQVVTGGSSSTKWRLQAKLDIPRGIDIKKDIDLTIG